MHKIHNAEAKRSRLWYTIAMKKQLMSVCAAMLALAATAREITVVGKGTVTLPPDKMKMMFRVSAVNQDIVSAKSLFAERTASLAATLAEVGIETNEILTSGLNLDTVKEWENGKMVFRGYSFSEWYTFVAPLDRARLERLYTSLVDCKTIEELNLSFELFDTDAPKQEAIARAVKDARAKAEAIARTAGVRLGKIDEIVYGCEGDNRYERGLMKTNLAVADGASMTVGELHKIEISDSVRIRWNIK